MAVERQLSSHRNIQRLSPAQPHPIRSDPVRRLSYGNQAAQRLLSARAVQAKLNVSQPGDKYEQQADQVADEVMRIPAAHEIKTGRGEMETPGLGIQRMCGKCEAEVHRQPGEDNEGLQAKEVSGQTPQLTPQVGRQVDGLRGTGEPLPDSTRRFFEPRLGQDLSRVRVHTDVRATESTRALNARAYTRGTDVVFGAGEYAPETSRGRRLLAHELTHVTQQSRSDSLSTIQRQAVAPVVPAFRDCNPAITGVPDSNEQLEAARLRAREFVGAARRRLAAAPVAGTNYAVALNRHFIAPGPADRTTIENNYGQILSSLRVSNYICNSQNICGTEQAFFIASDDLVHLCRAFWPMGTTCKAIILIHEGAHDIGLGIGGHPPNRGSANYPAGNTAPPVGQTTAARMNNPDAYAFFAAQVWRDTDTGLTCF